MSDQTEQVKDTLRYPDKIMPFIYDSAVSFYYRYCKEKKQYLLVSVIASELNNQIRIVAPMHIG